MVERRSPKPEVGSSIPSTPATKQNYEKPFKILQEVKQEAFRVTWPTKKDVVTGSLMVFVLASLAAVFFLILDQILKFLLNLVLNINF